MKKTGSHYTDVNNTNIEKIIAMSKERIKQIISMATIWIGLVVGSVLADEGRDNNMVYLDLNLVKKNTDVILVGRLVPVPPPYEVLGRDFYQIIAKTVINGGLMPNSLLVMTTNIDSSEGRPVKIELDMPYMLFLQKVDLASEGLPDRFVAYRLIGNWKGIVALDPTAHERRAIRRIELQHGIKIDDTREEFVEAINASFIDTQSQIELSDGGRAVFNALNLKVHKKKDMETDIAPIIRAP
jgi:hypothetical protein